MQVVTFNIPRLYNDIFFRVGGYSYDTPFAEMRSLIPFVQDDFENIDRFVFGGLEDLKTFFGIDDNSPLPPTLNFKGRGRDLLDAKRLNDLHAELQPIFGYPGWLYLPLKEWVKYEMRKENERWLNLNGGNEVEKLNRELKDFAGVFKNSKAFVSKFQFVLKMTDENIKKQLGEPFFFFDTLKDGAEYKKKIFPSNYLNTNNKNQELIEILLPKKYPLDYLKYFGFLARGDKSISIALCNWEKVRNDYKIYDYYFQTYPTLHFGKYPLFSHFPDLTPSSEIYSLIVFYETKDFFVPAFKLPKNTKEKEEPEAPEVSEEPKPKTTKPKETNLSWLWLALLFILLLITFKKASE